MKTSIDSRDLDQIIRDSSASLLSLRKANVLISGASGFVGTWLTSTLLHADKKLDLDLQVTVIVRNRSRILNRLGDVPNNLAILEIDYLKKHEISLNYNFSHIIQATTPSMPSSGSGIQENVANISYRSNRALIDFARKHKIAPVFCHLSSGAVYGNPEKIAGPIEENVISSYENLHTNYASIKRKLEWEVEYASYSGDLRGCNPRLFTFGGPFLQLDGHFAVGNFMQNLIRKEPILIKGHPSTIRSYMYPTDLISFLLALLNNPTLDPIHVGSSQGITMLELATLFSELFQVSIEVDSNMNSGLSTYYPSTKNTERYLGVKQQISLKESLLRWAEWLQN